MEVIELPSLLPGMSLNGGNNMVPMFSDSPLKLAALNFSNTVFTAERNRTISQSSDLGQMTADDLLGLGELSGGPYADMVDPASDIYKALDYDLTRHFCDDVSEKSPIFLPPQTLSPPSGASSSAGSTGGQEHEDTIVSPVVQPSQLKLFPRKTGKEDDTDEEIIVDSPMTSPLPPPQLVGPPEPAPPQVFSTNTAGQRPRPPRRVIRLDASKLRAAVNTNTAPRIQLPPPPSRSSSTTAGRRRNRRRQRQEVDSLPPLSDEDLQAELQRLQNGEEQPCNKRPKQQLYDKVPVYMSALSRGASVVKCRDASLLRHRAALSSATGSSASNKSQEYSRLPAYKEDYTESTRWDEEELRGGNCYPPVPPVPPPVQKRKEPIVHSITVKPTPNQPQPEAFLPHGNEDEVNNRKILFVGRLPKAWGDAEMRLRQILRENNLGPVRSIVVHQRFNQHLDSFAFLYFLHRRDAYAAYDFFQKSAEFKNMNVGFGGRLGFLRGQEYTDYDGAAEVSTAHTITGRQSSRKATESNDFEDLLKSYQQIQRSRRK